MLKYLAFFIIIIYDLYFLLPSIGDTYSYLTFVCIGFMFFSLFMYFENFKSMHKKRKIISLTLFSSILGLIFIFIFSSPMIYSIKYSNIIKENNISISKEDLIKSPESVRVSNRSIAEQIANKLLGKKHNGIQINSQYNLDMENASIIEYHNDMTWVIPLSYNGFFKWINQKNIPGYILVSAIDDKKSPKLVLDKPFIISNSSYFHENLDRHAWINSDLKETFSHFEIDEEGNPFWITSIIKSTIGVSGLVVEKILVTNALTGDIDYFYTDSILNKFNWIDQLYPEDIILEQINDKGLYSDGWINSIFQKLNTTQATSYNQNELWFVKIGDKKVWFTGMTSINIADQSLVQIMMVDARNGSLYNSIDIIGMDETGAINILNSALGANAVKWHIVLPQPLLIKDDWYWSGVVVSKNSIYQKIGIIQMDNLKNIHFGKDIQEVVNKINNINNSSIQNNINLSKQELIQIKINNLKSDLINFIEKSSKNIEELERLLVND
jgi:hypothetical protein